MSNDFTTFGNSFAVITDTANVETEELDALLLQFFVQDATLWDTILLPTQFDLADFDPFGATMLNSMQNGVSLPPSAYNDLVEIIPLESSSLSAVQLPAGLILMLSALLTLTGISKK